MKNTERIEPYILDPKVAEYEMNSLLSGLAKHINEPDKEYLRDLLRVLLTKESTTQAKRNAVAHALACTFDYSHPEIHSLIVAYWQRYYRVAKSKEETEAMFAEIDRENKEFARKTLGILCAVVVFATFFILFSSMIG